jgi:hypothetical protein
MSLSFSPLVFELLCSLVNQQIGQTQVAPEMLSFPSFIVALVATAMLLLVHNTYLVKG